MALKRAYEYAYAQLKEKLEKIGKFNESGELQYCFLSPDSDIIALGVEDPGRFNAVEYNAATGKFTGFTQGDLLEVSKKMHGIHSRVSRKAFDIFQIALAPVSPEYLQHCRVPPQYWFYEASYLSKWKPTLTSCWRVA